MVTVTTALKGTDHPVATDHKAIALKGTDPVSVTIVPVVTVKVKAKVASAVAMTGAAVFVPIFPAVTGAVKAAEAADLAAASQRPIIKKARKLRINTAVVKSLRLVQRKTSGATA
jgi:hypothetical protein